LEYIFSIAALIAKTKGNACGVCVSGVRAARKKQDTYGAIKNNWLTAT